VVKKHDRKVEIMQESPCSVQKLMKQSHFQEGFPKECLMLLEKMGSKSEEFYLSLSCYPLVVCPPKKIKEIKRKPTLWPRLLCLHALKCPIITKEIVSKFSRTKNPKMPSLSNTNRKTTHLDKISVDLFKIILKKD